MDEAGGRGRLHAVDHIKAAAIVAVVFTHAGRGSFEAWANPIDFALTSLWVRFQVPSFLFVSGLLYARAQPVGAREVGGRLWRVLIPYAIASCLALWVRPDRPGDLGEALFRLASGSALGVYYYVFLIVACIPLIWPLSRMNRKAVLAAWGAVFALTLLLAVQPSLAPPRSSFWAWRNPLRFFSLGYFLSGWLVALWLPEITRRVDRHRRLAWGAAACAVAFGLASFAQALPFRLPPVDRMIYTFGVIGLVALATRGREVGPWLRLLGDATLGLYLYHRMFQILVMPLSNGWPDLARIGAQVALGLGGALLVVVLGRRLLGRGRARRLLGA